MRKHLVAIGVGFLALSGSLALLGGCVGNFFFNLAETRDGNSTILIINNTDYRAAFTMGSYNQYDLNPPEAADWDQRTVEAHSTGEFSVTCDRVTAIGTDRLIERLLLTYVPDNEDIDEDSFTDVINFSSAPADSEAPTAANVGTAEGMEVQLGVDYACGDQLIFTLEQDPSAPGGFRVDYELVQIDGNRPDYGF